MRKLRVIVLYCLVILSACNSTEPNKTSNQSIQLTFVDAASIEAWVEINLENVPLPAKLSFNKNNNYAFEVNITSNDTIICLDSMSPNNNYSVQAATNEQKSNLLQFTTLDTTSHDITWSSYMFGGGASSWLNDIAILDDGQIIAVGTISKEGEFQRYNCVRIENNIPQFERIFYYYNGSPMYAELHSISSPGNNDYWVAADLPIAWYNNKYNQWTYNSQIFHSWIYTMWAWSNEDVYIGGTEGNLAHYDGIKWEKINSRTSYQIGEMCGYKGYKSKQKEVLFITLDYINYDKSKLAKLVEKNVTHIEEIPMNGQFGDVWTNKGYPIFISAYKLYSNKYGGWKEIELNSPCQQKKLKGNNLNDLFTIGVQGSIGHYNGKTWKVYGGDNADIIYYGIAVKGNTIAVCGEIGSYAFIKIGKRN